MNSERLVPPFFTSWAYRENRLGVIRNRLMYTGMKVATRSIEAIINRHRRALGLKPLTQMDDSFSPFAQICQQNREFDYPRHHLPECFHYVGPIFSRRAADVQFPWDRLDGRPLIYASLGTLVNRHTHLYRMIAASCQGLDAQLVISLGGADHEVEAYQNLPGSPLVVKFAPQRELISRAALTVAHAGLNTALESLAHGVPLVAIPITFDQPGVAGRIRWSGTGEFVSLPESLSGVCDPGSGRFSLETPTNRGPKRWPRVFELREAARKQQISWKR